MNGRSEGDERDELRAENKRLRAGLTEFQDRLRVIETREAGLLDQHAEIERLRAALKTIASAADWHPDDMQAFARAACR